MATVRREAEWVLLGQAGYSAAEIEAQVSLISSSIAFDDMDRLRGILAYLVDEALRGYVPQAEALALHFGSTGKTFAKTNTARLRKLMELHYARYAKRDEIHLVIPPKSYLVVAPRNLAELSGVGMPSSAYILEPADNSEISVRATVRGRISSLDPDLRVWLVVLAGDGCYYLQGRISRRSPTFEMTTRSGRLQLGKHEGEAFMILLVSADFDADHEFHRNMKRCDEGFGGQLPEDTHVLASIKVVRRDNRPNGPVTEMPMLSPPKD